MGTTRFRPVMVVLFKQARPALSL